VATILLWSYLESRFADIVMRTGFTLMLCLFGFAALAAAQEVEAPNGPDQEFPRVSRLPPIDAPPATSPAAVAEEIATGTATPVAPGEEFVPALAEPAEQGWFYWYEPWVKKWEGSFELGLNGAAGNTDSSSLRFGGKLKRGTDFSNQMIELLYNDQSSEGRNTARNMLLNAKVDWPLAASPWSLYIHSLGEYDEFKPFDYRLSADGGLEYAFFKTDVTKLTGRFGGSASREFGGIDDDTKPELVFGLDWERKFSDRQKASAKVAYYPNVTDFTDCRINSEASWEVVVDPTWGLSLKFSAVDRYDSTPSGAKRNDINYAALLLWSF
jgi:putative salt-induced outer membrane protein YdiY